jgi:glycosyltransferase involved in cell wall biosynthesis
MESMALAIERDRMQRREGGRRVREGPRSPAPLVSILTVVFRDRDELERILQNLFGFDTEDFEVVVVDGGSDDGTLELLRQWDDRIDYWWSGPDAGIYDAMNKAVKAARGEYLLHLNAGDRLLALPVEQLAQAQREGIDIAAFRISTDGLRDFYPNTWLLKLKNTLHHQGTFYRRQIFPEYDLQYKVLADFDVNQRLALRGAKTKIYKTVVATHASGGISASSRADREMFHIVRKNHGRLHVALAWMVWKERGRIGGLLERARRMMRWARSFR